MVYKRVNNTSGLGLGLFAVPWGGNMNKSNKNAAKQARRETVIVFSVGVLLALGASIQIFLVV